MVCQIGANNGCRLLCDWNRSPRLFRLEVAQLSRPVVGLLPRADRHLVKVNVSYGQSEKLTGAKPADCGESEDGLVRFTCLLDDAMNVGLFEIHRFGSVAVAASIKE